MLSAKFTPCGGKLTCQIEFVTLDEQLNRKKIENGSSSAPAGYSRFMKWFCTNKVSVCNDEPSSEVFTVPPGFMHAGSVLIKIIGTIPCLSIVL